MKRLELDIESCWKCPYLSVANFSSFARQGDFNYCHKAVIKLEGNSPLELAKNLIDTALQDTESIPSWCPLPDEGDRP